MSRREDSVMSISFVLPSSCQAIRLQLPRAVSRPLSASCGFGLPDFHGVSNGEPFAKACLKGAFIPQTGTNRRSQKLASQFFQSNRLLFRNTAWHAIGYSIRSDFGDLGQFLMGRYWRNIVMSVASSALLEGETATCKETSQTSSNWDDCEIMLTPKEKQVFDLLLEVVQHNGLKTELRVAGGWVRDKLLGQDSLDVDIALDDMLGVQFAQLVNDHLRHKGLQTRSVGVIRSNPEQSKHLETAHTWVCDLPIDFVNLRCEEYSHTSRIPMMTLGTAEEDAFRRDLTINALFFNVTKRRVEDLTGRGLHDLRAGVIRTPLPPRVTFLDDPLRILRAIRFASRLNFELCPEMKTAVKEPEVHDALELKVSRERIGIEVQSMLQSPHPTRALSLICEMNLYPIVFPIPATTEPRIADMHALRIYSLKLVWRVFEFIMRREEISKENQVLVLLATFLSPLWECKYDARNRRKHGQVVHHIVREALRLSSKQTQTVCHLIESSKRLSALVRLSYQDASVDRVRAGMELRFVGPMWKYALDLAQADDLVRDAQERQLSRDSTSKEEQIRTMYAWFEDQINSLQLEGVWDIKPIFDGNELCKALRLRPGRQVGQLLHEQVEWMLQNPQGSPEQCWDYLALRNTYLTETIPTCA